MEPQTITLTTDRLILKELTPELYDHLFANKSDDELMQFFGWTNKNDLDQEKDKHSKGMVTYFISFRSFLMIEKESNRVIGKLGFHTLVAIHGRGEIGYQIYKDEHKQKGYMTEALAPVLDYGFNNLKLNRIEAMASPTNTPSIKLLERYGFVREGLLRKHYRNNGIAEDSACYGLLKNEFEQLTGK